MLIFITPKFPDPSVIKLPPIIQKPLQNQNFLSLPNKSFY